MMSEIRLKSRVLPGKRIELSDPALEEGQAVDIIISPSRADRPESESVRDYLRSLPRRERTPEEWAQFEKDFQAERDSWDR